MFEIMSFNVTLSVPFDWCIYDTFIKMFYCYVLKINNICTLLCKNFDHFWYICVPESKLGFFKNHRRIFTLKKKEFSSNCHVNYNAQHSTLLTFPVILCFWCSGSRVPSPDFRLFDRDLLSNRGPTSDFSGSYVSQMGRGRFDDVMFSAENTFASVSALGTWVV